MAAYTITCFSALDKVLHAAELGRRLFSQLDKAAKTLDGEHKAVNTEIAK